MDRNIGASAAEIGRSQSRANNCRGGTSDHRRYFASHFLTPPLKVDIMSTVEAAASLFGPEDSFSDPFTALGATLTASQTPTYDPHNPETDTGDRDVDFDPNHTLDGVQDGFPTLASRFQGPQAVDHPIYDTPPHSNAAVRAAPSRPEEPRSQNDSQQRVYENLPAQTGVAGIIISSYARPK